MNVVCMHNTQISYKFGVFGNAFQVCFVKIVCMSIVIFQFSKALIFTLHVNLQDKDKLSCRVRYFCLNMFCFVFPFLFFCCCCCLCFLVSPVVLLYPGPSTQQYLKIQIRPPAIGSVVMVNGDCSHIFSLPLTPPPPPSQPLTHQPLFTSFGYNMPTCSTIGYEPASSCSEEPQKETGINTHIQSEKYTCTRHKHIISYTWLFF